MQHYILSNMKNQKTTGFTIPLDTTYLWKNNQKLSDKASAEELDKNNQKRLQNIVGKLLYYTRYMDPTMLMELNSLAAVQKNPTIETAKQITQF